MPQLRTKYFGLITFQPDTVYHFPAGIPGFEDQVDFLFVEQPCSAPLVFMQSVLNTDVCFVALPVQIADPSYRLDLAREEAETIQVPYPVPNDGRIPLLCLALVTLYPDADPTLNLAAPIVLNVPARLGVQSVENWRDYSRNHPIANAREASACS